MNSRLLLILLLSTAAVGQPAALAEIDVPAGVARPFLISNGTGTYFYGATNSDAWDPGWMGLWVDRKRVLSSLDLYDSTDAPLDLKTAACEVTPHLVTWHWDRTQQWFRLRFDGATDTLCWSASPGLYAGRKYRLIERGQVPWSSAAPMPDAAEHRLAQERDFAFICEDAQYREAMTWCHSQLLSMLAENDSLLYAGIPWFNEGWGRDTFISLPALLVTGHADVAKKLIVRFANWIDRDPNSVTYGRIPNRVRPGEEIAYNTADGTPWWIRSVYMYGLYTRDFTLWHELLFERVSDAKPWAGAGRDAINGALLNCDSLGFLTHADQETWMDAVGTTGCVTPRGNRAVEIQALHYVALDAAVKMSLVNPVHEFQSDFRRWREMRSKLEKHFLAAYQSPGANALRDHLNADGTSDSLLRPNQLFALTAPFTPLLPDSLRETLVREVCAGLVQGHGVLSLSPQEPLFHPFHMDEHYPKDDAYHNGIVWLWLSGPAKDALCMEGRADLGLKIASYEADYLLNHGLVGSLPELFDAMPRKGERKPRLSGCTSQTWGIAEFLRATYQDFLGIRPVLVPNKTEAFWLIDPRIPESWGQTHARVVLDGMPVLVTLQNFGDSLTVTLQAETKPAQPMGIKVFAENGGITGYLSATDPVHFVYRHADGYMLCDGVPTAQLTLTGWPWDAGNQQIALAKPLKLQKWPSLAPKPWAILTAKEALAKNEQAQRVVDTWDPIGDSNGDGDYTCPQDEHFAPGILDIASFTLKEDKKYYYFTLAFANLVDPGWHPEYGFQLSFAAICLHDGKGMRTAVGANSNYTFPDTLGCSRIIYVGGGFRMEDESGQTLCEFTPRSTAEAFGDVKTRRVQFAIPAKFFPKSDSHWSFTVLSGAQDDHGGAGMGEFRAVKAQAEQWAGGGNEGNGPNIYDTLFWRRSADTQLHIRQ